MLLRAEGTWTETHVSMDSCINRINKSSSHLQVNTGQLQPSQSEECSPTGTVVLVRAGRGLDARTRVAWGGPINTLTHTHTRTAHVWIETITGHGWCDAIGSV